MQIVSPETLKLTGGHIENIEIMLFIENEETYLLTRWLTPLDAELQAQWIV